MDDNTGYDLMLDSAFYVGGHFIANGDAEFKGGAGAVTVTANSDIRFVSGNWTGESLKIQGHNNSLYVQGGSNGIILRGSDAGDIASFQNTATTFHDPVNFSGDATFSGGAAAVMVPAGSDIRLATGSWTGDYSCKIQAHNNSIYIQGGSNGHVFRRHSSQDCWYISGAGDLYPAADSTYDLGTNSNRIEYIFGDYLALGDNGGSPSARLAIQHDSGYNIYLEGNGWSGEAGIGFGGSGTANGVADGSTGARIACVSSAPSGQASGYLKLYTNPGDNLTERVRIRANGDLDIRTQDASSMVDTYQRLRFTTHQTNGQACSTAAIVAHGVSGWGGNLEFWTKDNNGTPDEQLRHTMTLQGDNHRMFMYGDIHFDGSATTTNQARQIYWTGFDKEGTTDYSDVAGIEHTTNTGGLSGSVLKIRVSNDASGDGIYLDANGGVNVANTMRMQSGNFQPRAAENSIKWQNDAFGGGGDYARIDYYRDGSGENTRLRVQIENDSDDDLRLEAGTIRAEGSFSKSGGSFLIPHPNTSAGISTTHNLAHSFIEGPQMDLIYRGKIDLSSGTASINIDTKAGMAEGTFVILCKDIQCFTSNETGWGAVKGSVSGNILTITAQDNSSTDTISWMVVGERQDATVKSLKMTDDDGEFIVQPPKDAFELNGILPPLPAMNGAQQIT